MCLADKVAHCAAAISIERAGHVWHFPDSSAFAEAIEDADVRYVLLDDVRSACEDVSTTWKDLIDPANPRLRAPMMRLWIEWIDAGSQRVGVLVDAARDGRSGSLRVFWDGGAGVDVAQGTILFDLDHPLAGQRLDGRRSFPLGDLPADLSSLAPHLALVVDEDWERYFITTPAGLDPLRAAAAQCAERLWPDAIVTFAFFALLGARLPVHERPIVRDKLNAARMRKGKPKLLNHAELTIGRPRLAADSVSAGGGRRTPRLHAVRGHLVRRRDQVFWRSPHMRGLENAQRAAPRTRVVAMHSD